MKLKISLVLLFVIGLQLPILSQESKDPQYQIGLNTGLFFTGDFRSIYNVHAGVEGKYFLKHTGRFHHYLTGGFSTEVGTEGANLFAFDLGVGTQFDVVHLWNRPFYLSLNAGGLYWQERFSTQFIDGTVGTNISDLGFKANLGIGYQLSNRFSFQINLTQFSTEGTSGGFGILYSF